MAISRRTAQQLYRRKPDLSASEITHTVFPALQRAAGSNATAADAPHNEGSQTGSPRRMHTGQSARTQLHHTTAHEKQP